MVTAIFNKLTGKSIKTNKEAANIKNLSGAPMNKTYIIKEVQTRDKDMENFLFTLGCYEGEEVTVISKLAGNFVISVKDARYSIDSDLAKAIII